MLEKNALKHVNITHWYNLGQAVDPFDASLWTIWNPVLCLEFRQALLTISEAWRMRGDPWPELPCIGEDPLRGQFIMIYSGQGRRKRP